MGWRVVVDVDDDPAAANGDDIAAAASQSLFPLSFDE